MAAPKFKCVYEKDNNPPLSKEADQYIQTARQLEKLAGVRNWPLIESNYQKAIDLNHWKAMNNLAILYRKGAYNVDHPTGIIPNSSPFMLGWYNSKYLWATTIGRW